MFIKTNEIFYQKIIFQLVFIYMSQVSHKHAQVGNYFTIDQEQLINIFFNSCYMLEWLVISEIYYVFTTLLWIFNKKDCILNICSQHWDINDSNWCFSIKRGYFIKIWGGYFKIQGEILNSVRINNTAEPRYNEHGLYQIRRYRTLVSDHKSTLR